MKWVITKFCCGHLYFLHRVVQTRNAVWTTDTKDAIRYSTEKAARYTISNARLREADIRQIKTIPSSHSRSNDTSDYLIEAFEQMFKEELSKFEGETNIDTMQEVLIHLSRRILDGELEQRSKALSSS